MELSESLQRKILFVHGKGGVGKSTIARGGALALARAGRKVLLVVIDDPVAPPGVIEPLLSGSPDGSLSGSAISGEPDGSLSGSSHGERTGSLSRLNCEPASAFEQYAAIKIGSAMIAKLFTHNKLMRYLVQAAPGIKELTIMGKIWHERKNFDHVVVDLPATGHGITLFQAIRNWKRLFEGSPLEKDSAAMIETLSDPRETSHLIIALPEEMPMVEALELEASLRRILPRTETSLVLNRVFPIEGAQPLDPSGEKKPFASTLERHLQFRLGTEERNRQLWKERSFLTVPYFVPPAITSLPEMAAQVADRLRTHVKGGPA